MVDQSPPQIQQHLASMYQCGICKTEYARADHLIRHIRSHTKDRPFICTVCGKGFGRQDLLRRHSTIHNAIERNNPPLSTESFSRSERHGHRVHQACRPCAAKKVKCTETKPCQRCKEKNLDCVYAVGLHAPTDASLPASDVVQIPQQEQEEECLATNDFAENNEMSMQSQQHTSWSVLLPTGIDNTSSDRSMMPATDQFVSPSDHATELLQSILASGTELPQLGSTEMDEEAVFEDMDFSFLTGIDDVPEVTPIHVSPPTPEAPSIIGAATDVYRTSDVLTGWNPSETPSSEQAQQDLILLQPLRATALPVRELSIYKKSLSIAVRDRILTMILHTTSRLTANRIIASFPTLDQLGYLITHGFEHMQSQQMISFLHFPTLDLDTLCPETLAAFVAYGSICSLSSEVRRFGYAIQDVVRVAVHNLVEGDHQTLRQPEAMQAFYIQLYLGYYSDNGRKIELAECQSMLGTTLLRRGKELGSYEYRTPQTFLEMPDLSLRQKWLMWVNQESMIRLVYFAMTLDVDVSHCRQINTMFRYSEMQLPLPTTSRLWAAETAEQWYEVLKASNDLRMKKPNSLAQLLPLSSPVCQSDNDIVDLDCAIIIALSGIELLVQEYRQMYSLLAHDQSATDFVLNCRHSQILSMLDHVKSDLADQENLDPRVFIMQQLVSLHLNVWFDAISNYSGGKTEQDALKSVPYTKHWHSSSRSRQALWHASQIFRYTRSLKARSLTDIYALALYQSTVVVWVWGLVQRTHGPRINEKASKVMLDLEETPEVQKYVRSGTGVPGIRDQSGKFIRLDEPASIADLARDIILGNWDQGQLPCTPEGIIRVVCGLSSITRKRFGNLTHS